VNDLFVEENDDEWLVDYLFSLKISVLMFNQSKMVAHFGF
jgi:hypothetical protein